MHTIVGEVEALARVQSVRGTVEAVRPWIKEECTDTQWREDSRAIEDS
jgi:hypothetical protein